MKTIRREVKYLSKEMSLSIYLCYTNGKKHLIKKYYFRYNENNKRIAKYFAKTEKK